MKYIYTFGAFDLLHAGHVKLLEDAKKLGESVTIGLFTDKVVKGYKREPIISYEQRYALLKALRMVDSVIPQNELSPIKNIQQLKKEISECSYSTNTLVVAKGPGANWEHEYTQVGEKTNTLCLLLPYHPIASTTDIINKIKDSLVSI